LAISALVYLESFVRDRTEEILQDLGSWPGNYDDLPENFRDAALLHSLQGLHRYAKLQKREGEDYRAFITTEAEKIASTTGPSYRYSKFIAGDFTGNLSEELFKNILSYFQVKDCWTIFHTVSSRVGFGVPSVKNVLLEITRNRHASAHQRGFVPSTDFISGLPNNLLLLALCFDLATTASVRLALANWRNWSTGDVQWLNATTLWLIDPANARFRLRQWDRNRAHRLIDQPQLAGGILGASPTGKTTAVIERDSAGLPVAFMIC
jgi:hypothetical protein